MRLSIKENEQFFKKVYCPICKCEDFEDISKFTDKNDRVFCLSCGYVLKFSYDYRETLAVR